MRRVAVVLAVLACGCGGGGGGGGHDSAVARVAGKPISKAEFQHWLRVFAVQLALGGDPDEASGVVEVPQPPDFKQCVAAKAKPGALAICRQEYERLRDQALQTLITARWISGEAAAQGVTVSDAEARTQLKRSFPRDADLRRYLKTSGTTLDDLLLRARVELLAARVRQRAARRAAPVSEAALAAYYGSHQALFSRPQRRDLHMVKTRGRAAARRALAALRSGRSWREVARRYAVDWSPNNPSALTVGAVRGDRDRALDRTIFNARRGRLVGPVRTQYGYYVLSVRAIHPASRRSLASARKAIENVLAAQSRQRALTDFDAAYRERWRARTTCSKGYVIALCGNR